MVWHPVAWLVLGSYRVSNRRCMDSVYAGIALCSVAQPLFVRGSPLSLIHPVGFQTLRRLVYLTTGIYLISTFLFYI